MPGLKSILRTLNEAERFKLNILARSAGACELEKMGLKGDERWWDLYSRS